MQFTMMTLADNFFKTMGPSFHKMNVDNSRVLISSQQTSILQAETSTVASRFY